MRKVLLLVWIVLFLYLGEFVLAGEGYSNNAELVGLFKKPPVDDSTLIYLDFSDYYIGSDGYHYFRNLGKLDDARVWNPSGITVVETPAGSGVHFSGSSYLWIPTKSEYDTVCEFTLALVFLGDGTAGSDEILINKENHIEVGRAPAGDYANFPDTISFALSRRWDWIGSGVVDSTYWKVYILTYDGRYARAYINGKLVHSYDFGSYGCLPSYPSNWMIGARGGSNSYNNFSGVFAVPYHGTIAFVGFWLRAFSETEVIWVTNYFYTNLYGVYLSGDDEVSLYLDWSNLVDQSKKIFVDNSAYRNVCVAYNPDALQVTSVDGKRAVYISNNYIHVDRGVHLESKLCTFSIIMEIYPTMNPTKTYVFINKENHFELGYNSNRFAFAIKRDWKWFYSSASFPPNKWYTILFSYDGRYGRLYVDGQSVVNHDFGSFACNPVVGTNLWIGARSFGTSTNTQLNLFKLDSPSYSIQGYYGKTIIVSKPLSWDEALQYLQSPPKEASEISVSVIGVETRGTR